MEETKKPDPKPEAKKPDEPKPVKRKTLAELFNESCTVAIHHTHMHQAFQLPGAGTESSLNPNRRTNRGLELVYHPGYGLIGRYKGKYFLSPSANLIVGHESE